MTDMNEVVEKQIELLAQMVLRTGWLAYAKQRAKELEEDESGLFVGITEKVRERVRETQ
jgi:glycine cleavage system H lipoate-binding protein